MSSNSYWEKRQAQRMFEYMESAERAADEIADLYHKAALYLDLSIDDIFERYRTKHHLTEEQAKELLKNLPDNSTIQDLKHALQNDKYNKHKQELLKELESPAYESRIRRIEYIRLQVDDMMENVYHQEKQSSMSHYINLASEAYYKSMFEMQKRTGLGFGFSHVSQSIVDRIINSKWSGENYSSRIWNNTKTLAETVKQELLLGLITGKTNREVAKDIELQFAVGANKARRLVRTESNYLCGQMAMESYKAAGIEKYRFLATLDLRTSELCRSLDGKVFMVSEQQPGKNCNPMHPWCRSTTISITEGEVLAKLKRAARDPATGKAITVPADMTYEQWYRKFVTGNPEAKRQEKKVKNLSADRRQYEQYKKVLGDNLPKTLDDFQDMKYNEGEEWEYTKGLKAYLDKYPTSDKRYYDADRKLKELGIKKGMLLPPVQKQAFILPEGERDPYHIMNRMLERNITDDNVRAYMKNAKAMFVQWGGARQRFMSEKGMCVITKTDDEWIYKTVWSRYEFDEEAEKIMEVLKSVGL